MIAVSFIYLINLFFWLYSYWNDCKMNKK